MRSKAKYMAIVAIVVVAILAITLVSCGGGGKVAEETTNWLASAKKATVTDTVTISDVKINFSDGLLVGDLVKIENLDIVATRVIAGDKLSLSLKVQNIKGVVFSDLVNSVLGNFLKDINLSGISDIGGIEIKLNYDPSAETVLTGEFHGYDLNKIVATAPEGDSNPKNEKFINLKADEVSGEDHEREEKLIAGIVDLLDNPIYGPSTFDKKGNATSNVANIVALAKLALEEYGEDNFWDSNGNETQYNAKALVNMIFGKDSHENLAGIFNDVLSIAQLKLNSSETQKVDGKEVYSKTDLSANVDVLISDATVMRIAANIGSILSVFGVDLGGLNIGGILKGEITLEAGVKVVTTYVNG